MPNAHPNPPPPNLNKSETKIPTLQTVKPTYWYSTPNLPVRCLTDTSRPVVDVVPDHHRHDPIYGETLPF